MTKNELINKIHSLKIDLKYLKKELQFRMDGNNIESISEKHKDSYAAKAGAFEACVMMDNSTFERSIKSIENMEKDLEL